MINVVKLGIHLPNSILQSWTWWAPYLDIATKISLICHDYSLVVSIVVPMVKNITKSHFYLLGTESW